MEFVVEPVTLVGYFAVGVVELAKAIHGVMLPFPLVMATVGIGELSEAMLHSFDFVAFVFVATFVGLFAIFRLVVF